MKALLAWIGAGFGLGYFPLAPGTVGSLLGLPLAWWVNSTFGIEGQVMAALLFALIAIPVCQAVENKLRVKDPKPCVADEYLTYPICLIGLPVAGQPEGWTMMGIAFVTHRFFDIVKLWPAFRLQRLSGGLGIVADDVFASLYALAANHLIYRWYLAAP
ncbi:MAG: phosphatidylglycerophosphatase A [Kiritimatiellae bacterium]|nr:phosphatidylglycerophosphatase A [Kiritimatiellia bacterium]MDW8457615.1 phosphatidylglycerophosphatase A [Verrucomicrobiota bacterium]